MKTGHLIKIISNQLDAGKNEKLKQDNLTSSQLELLFFLDSRSETTSQKDIGEYFGVRHTTVIHILKRLEEKGFIGRKLSEVNARFRDVYLTDKGREKVAEMRSKRKEIEEILVRGMDRAEQKELNRLLHKVYDNLKV